MSTKVRNVLSGFETLSEMFCRIQRLTPDVQLNVIGDTLPESMRGMIPAGVDAAAVDAAWKRGPERADIYPELGPNEINEAIIHIIDVITASDKAGATNPLYLVLIALLNGVGMARSERDQFRKTIEQLVAENQATSSATNGPPVRWPPKGEVVGDGVVSQDAPPASA